MRKVEISLNQRHIVLILFTSSYKIHNFKGKLVRLKTIIPFLILALVSGCNSPKTNKELTQSKEAVKSELNGSFSISGAYALYPLKLKLADEFMVIHPESK